jgi:molybdopterin/thiamine biosynthesis adenylyltransferase
MLDLADDARYERQTRLFGAEGQKRLKRATALVVGAGGLGSSVSTYLAVAGLGRIIVVDGDVVEESNLNRQILHWTKDIGRPKAVSAAETIKGLNPEIEVEAVALFADEENLADLVSRADLVVDALDNFPSRYILNRAAIERGVPLFHGAISGFDGQATTIIPEKTPCLRCISPEGDEPRLGRHLWRHRLDPGLRGHKVPDRKGRSSRKQAPHLGRTPSQMRRDPDREKPRMHGLRHGKRTLSSPMADEVTWKVLRVLVMRRRRRSPEREGPFFSWAVPRFRSRPASPYTWLSG